MTSVLLAERPCGLLALGAHPDDVEIGCGGTLLQLAARYPGLSVTVVVFTGSAERHAESQAKLGRQLCRSAAGPAWFIPTAGSQVRK